jgi:hypothetical protein
MIWAIWIIFALLAALWTSLTWVSVLVLRWSVEWLSEGAKASSWLELMSNWSIPSWLLLWVDAQQIQALQLALVKLAEQLQGSWPGVGQSLSWIEPLVWGVWALGLLVLLAFAGLGHWLVKRQAKPPAAPPVVQK